MTYYEFERYQLHNETYDNLFKIVEDSLGNIWCGAIEGITQLSSDGHITSHKFKSIEKYINPLVDSLISEGIHIKSILSTAVGEVDTIKFKIEQEQQVAIFCNSLMNEKQKLLRHINGRRSRLKILAGKYTEFSKAIS